MRKRMIKFLFMLLIVGITNITVNAAEQREEINEGQWILNETGWWYEKSDGTWPYSSIVEINDQFYAFDKNGYMVSGWYEDSSGWYYFESDGVMYTGWLLYNSVWYYLDGNDLECPGRMAADKNCVVNELTYSFDSSGAMLTGWKLNPEGWYYFEASGELCTGWLLKNDIWYYLDETNIEYPGLMKNDGWSLIGEDWYYFNEDGAMVTDWMKKSEGWYYLGDDGSMKTGWQQIDNKWYYFYMENDIHGGAYGVMATNTVIDEWDILESGIAVNGFLKKIEEIKSYEGYPYVSGGNTPEGWDCSGFTQWALNYLGVKIGRSAEAQFNGGTVIDMTDMSSWQPGDVLIYISPSGYYSHAALYIGDGLLMHALNPSRGTVIQEVDYYERVDQSNTLAGVRRYL